MAGSTPKGAGHDRTRGHDLREGGLLMKLATRARNSAQVGFATARARRVAHWSPERIGRLQRRRIRAIVAYAYENVPFYREVMRRHGLQPHDFSDEADLATLPLIDATSVQVDPERFTSILHGRGRRWAFHTSGSSTGLRRVIYWDDRSVLREAVYDAARPGPVISKLAEERWAGTILRALVGERETMSRQLLGMVVGRTGEHRRISIFPADLSLRSMRALRSEETLIPRRAEHHHHVSPRQSLGRTAELLTELRPRVVFSFGSYADQYFRYLAEVRPAIALPKVWVYSGDVVSAAAREMAASFGCCLYSVYSAMEAGTIGFQCERTDGFHVNVDHCVLRLIDEEGSPVPPGQPGEVVISNLENRAMVLLNLRIGDRGVLAAERCPCGRGLPMLAQLEGRTSEFVTLADGSRMSALALEGIFAVQLRHVRRVQMVQSAHGELRWLIVPFVNADRNEMRRAILERAHEVLGPQMGLEVDFVEEIATTPQGKFRRVISNDDLPSHQCTS